MTTILLQREARRPAPPIERGDFPVQEPPGLPEQVGSNSSGTMMWMYLPMFVGSGAMTLFFLQPGQNKTLRLVSVSVMGLAILIMIFALLLRMGAQRKNQLKIERRDYLRYMGQIRKQIRTSVDKQRESVLFTHPEPSRLWAMVTTDRLWERRANHADFAEVRIGLGQQRLALQLQAPQTKPVADLEPLCASALRRFLRAYTLVEDMPVAVYLRGFARISLDGPPEINRALTNAILAQLGTFHSLEDLRIAVLAGGDRLRHWEWVKWLPQALHPDEVDGAGAARLVSDNWSDLERLLGGKALDERGRFEPGVVPTATEPLIVLVVDGPMITGAHRLAGPGYRGLVAIDIDESLPWDGADTTLRLRITSDKMEKVSLTRSGDEESVAIGRPDALSVLRARALARQIAPYRLSAITTPSTSDGDSTVASDLASLLNITDLWKLDPNVLWQARTAWDHLRVPIGLTGRGQTLELDLKEAAQGGMGPHGILIGATGSGKSELIRTLVLSLALTHSSEKLNMVLVDFKGGATFMGLEGLPHVSAVITNLADELPLVDRMQDALQGEMVRRQELLRKFGYTSVLEWEKARSGGADLKPMPTLVVIVDEFGELLTTKSEFGELFMMMGRLGRSLAVHLLLASQRFDEGRIHTLQTHLSYRIGLRMYSGMESRSVIGTADAYEQPLQPGTGFLRTDTTTLVKFRGAYVSGAAPTPRGQPRRSRRKPVSQARIVPFEAGYVTPLRYQEPEPEVEPADERAEPPTETMLEVIVNRLRNAGPPAHRVWLPPLDDPPTLDQMLPALRVDPTRGFGTPYGGLRVPVGLIDKPFEQRREPFVLDLSAAKGHVAVVGGPRSGKTTAIRTIVTALALTHTPSEVQFYLLDFGGGGLGGLADLPHVGGVAQRRDSERVNRTIAEIGVLLEHREQYFSRHGVDSMAAYRKARAAGKFADEQFGDVFLVIDGWFTMRQEFDKLEQPMQDIATRGLSYGVHVIIGAGRWPEMRPWLRDVVQSRLELRLGDPMESEMDFRKAKTVPEIPGRGLTKEKYHYLTALPRVDGRPSGDDVGDGMAALVAEVREHWTGRRAPGVRLLPGRFDVRDLPPPPEDGELKVAYALDENRLEPVWHDFAETPHLLALGDSETGRTNLLKIFIQAVTGRWTTDEAQIVLLDPRRRLQGLVPPDQLAYLMTGEQLRERLITCAGILNPRIPGGDIGPERLPRRDWWTGPRLFVFLDDYDMVSSYGNAPAEPLIPLLAHGSAIGLHVVVCRQSTSGMRAMMEPFMKRLWDLGTPGLLFATNRVEGTFLADAKPLRLPPGRAQFVLRRGGSTLIQIGLVTADVSDEGGGQQR